MGRTKTSPPSMQPKVAKNPTKGKRLPFKTKHIIENMKSFFGRERVKGIMLQDNVYIVEKTAKATEVSSVGSI